MIDEQGTERCDAKGCFVVRYPRGAIPQPSLQHTVWFGIDKAFCDHHYEQALEFERELPLAIQELHAWALLANPNFSPEQVKALETAEARVLRLRVLEALLKGN